ncbi:MAG TPA: hypothetical protein VGG16_16480 [Streptosporangiaceae bacterium]
MTRMHIPGRPRHWLSMLGTVALAAAAVTAVTVTPAPAVTGVPAFYLTINVGVRGTAAPQVDAHRTSDGAVTSTLPTASGWRTEDVSAAASDRTFFVAEQHGEFTCPSDRFLEFKVAGSGVITGVHQVGSRVSGMIGSLTSSPGGTRLAYTTVCTTPAHPEPVWVVHVMDLASGAVSSWTSAPKATGTADVTEAGEDALAWTANGKSLSFAYQWKPSQAYFDDMAVVLLNPDGGSGTLQAHSRVVWHQDTRCGPGPCVFNAWISPSGTSLMAEAIGASGLTLERLTLPAGRTAAVLFRTPVKSTGVGVPEPPAWLDGSGTYWLVVAGTQLGWVRQGLFHRLQPAGSTAAATW